MILSTLALLLVVAGCSEEQKPAAEASGLTQVTFRLDWIVDITHACFYAALSNGYFRDEGIDMQFLEGAGSSSTASLVANGSNDFGWVDTSVLIRSVNDGAPIKLVAAGFQRTPGAVISLKSKGINAPEDLVGKTVGAISGEAPLQLLDAYLSASGLNIKDVKVTTMDPAAKVPALLTGRVDAVVGYHTSEPLLVESQKPGESTTLRYADKGIVAMSNGIVANQQVIDEKPDVVKRVVRAIQRGFDYCKKDPNGAAEKLADRFPQSVNLDRAKAAVPDVTSLLHTDRTAGKPVGSIDRQDVANTLQTMQRYMGLREAKAPEHYYVDKFVS
ncbi:ABC transporter substrate-binding protein [Kribbella sp. CA-253562]|uniref:ABC transporter substrate-binding protein n=1 Tax=Kribbella sp. CA-253562 TaxID=3239942 RepID=UPI003D8DE9FB